MPSKALLTSASPTQAHRPWRARFSPVVDQVVDDLLAGWGFVRRTGLQLRTLLNIKLGDRGAVGHDNYLRARHDRQGAPGRQWRDQPSVAFYAFTLVLAFRYSRNLAASV
jgi:hypothetical protein